MKNVFVLSLLVCSSAFCQKPPAKFGDIPMQDMTMKIYPLDSSASAVVLFDYGISYFEISSADYNRKGLYSLFFPPRIFERHVRVKILKKEGLAPGRGIIDISILLLHVGQAEEKISNLKATTYNLENGKIVETELEKENLFKEKVNSNLNQLKFTMPSVREGAVIEYSYKLTSDFNGGLPGWQFQSSIPKLLSEYWAMEPNNIVFAKNMQGYLQLDDYTSEQKMFYQKMVTANHYVMKNVPAFKIEPYMTTENDYVSKIIFSISRESGQSVHLGNSVVSTAGEAEALSWRKINNRFLEANELVLKNSDFLKEETDRIITGMTESSQRISAISNYIKTHFEWDGTKDYSPDPLKKVFEKKKGSVADLNFLMAAMLDKAGYNVDMILLSTRDHGIVRKGSQMTSQFNYVICSVKALDKTYLLDATEKYLPYDVLPSRCLNGQGLVISKTNFGWVDITSKAKEKTIVGAEFALSNAGVLDGKINYAYDGYDALKFRKDYSDKGEEEYTKQFISNKQWSVVKNEFKDIKEIDKSAKVFYEINIDEHATAAGDIIYINPFVTNKIDENPFKSEKRLYPVDYGNKIEKVYNCKFTIPDGFTIDELPKSKIMAMPENGARYTYNVVQLNNAINITSNFQINKTIFLPEEYELLREFYNQVVAKQAEQIVLKKK